DLFRRVDERDDVLLGPTATGEPRERQGSAEERDHLSAGDPLGKLRGSLGELALEARPELRRVRELSEGAPVGLGHRWHPEQATGGCTGRSRSSAATSARESLGGVHFMLVTSETGRRKGPGSRWQSRHQLIESGCICVTTSIVSIRPWQVTQPIPAA